MPPCRAPADLPRSYQDYFRFPCHALTMFMLSPSSPASLPSKYWTEHMLSPRLPAELERCIFELAAKQDKVTAHNLTFVAKRLQIWFVVVPQYDQAAVAYAVLSRIEPILYRNVVLTSSFDDADDTASMFLYTVSRRSPQFFAKNVRSLVVNAPLSSPQVDVEEILSVCTGLKSFAYSSPFRAPEILPYLNRLTPTLRRLSISLDVLSSGGSGTVDWTLPFFTAITHLETPYLAESSLPPSHLLPNLQCLLVNDISGPVAAQTVLEQRPALKALAFINSSDGFDGVTLNKMVKGLNEDSRFVLQEIPNWCEQAWGHDQSGSDGWPLVLDVADRQKAEKKQGLYFCLCVSLVHECSSLPLSSFHQ